MKKFTVSALLIMFSIGMIFGQSPEAIKYQVVARDNNGNVLSNQTVAFRLTIFQGTPGGYVVYSENQHAVTNQFGLANLDVGWGSAITGTFSDIPWGEDYFFLQTEMDPLGGFNFVLMGTSQFLSVPYSMYAKHAANGMPSGSAGQTLRNNGAGWVADTMLTNTGTKIGIGTTNPQAELDVTGDLSITGALSVNGSPVVSPKTYLVENNTQTLLQETSWTDYMTKPITVDKDNSSIMFIFSYSHPYEADYCQVAWRVGVNDTYSNPKYVTHIHANYGVAPGSLSFLLTGVNAGTYTAHLQYRFFQGKWQMSMEHQPEAYNSLIIVVQ